MSHRTGLRSVGCCSVTARSLDCMKKLPSIVKCHLLILAFVSLSAGILSRQPSPAGILNCFFYGFP